MSMPRITIIILILAFLALGGIVYHNQFMDQQSSDNLPSQDSEIPESVGIIEGSLGYPSEGIPADMRICAENVQNWKKYCTDEQINDSKYTYDKGYQLEVPVGDYYVFAKVSNLGQYAYYSEFVTCGLDNDCSSHKPIKLRVEGGKSISGIDPIDWYVLPPIEGADFIETGNLVEGKDNKWALLYEEPGQPALKVDLSFNSESLCELEQEIKSCLILPDDFFEVGERVEIEGTKQGEKVVAYRLRMKETKNNLVHLLKPLPNEVIQSPLTVKGEARGNWFFEADFPVVLTDWDGLIISQGVAQTKDDWMTEDFISFEAELEFEKPELKDNGALILQKDNPSGLPENDEALEIQVFFE